MIKFLLIFFLSITSVFGQLKESDKQFLDSVNIIKNPGFENGIAQWTASGGTLATVTSTSNLAFGFASGSWDSNGNAQTLTTTQVTIPNGLLGSLDCVAGFYYKTTETTLTFKVINGGGSTIAGPTTLGSASNFTPTELRFSCPTSGTLAIRITSAVADSAIVYLDNTFLGISANFASGTLLSFSAGSVSAPGLSVIGDSDTGLYSPSSNNLRITTAGSDIAEFASGQTRLQNGTAGSPSLVSTNFNTTGLYWEAGPKLSAAAGTQSIWTITTNGFQLNSGSFWAQAGSTGTPSISFLNDSDTGFYNSTANTIAASAGGTLIWQVDATGVTMNAGVIYNKDGTVGAPSFTFSADTDTGIYRPSANILRITTAGADNAEFASGQIRAQDQSAGSPSFSFASDTDTGFYRSGANSIGIATNGTLTSTIDTSGLTLASGKVFYNADGAIGTPSFTFNSDADTGFYRVSANDFAAVCNGAKVLEYSTTGIAVTGTASASGGFNGTATNDSAASGIVGEILTANSAGVTPAASTSFANVVSKSLTAGDWDVECDTALVEAATLSATRFITAVSTSSAAMDSTNNGGVATENSFLVSSTAYVPTGARRISLSGTTTVYCVAALTYAVLSTTTYGTDSIIRARRAR